MWILSILVFVLIFSSLIVVHEWGHFRAARWANVRAEEFAVGFGKKIFGWKRGETDFRINAVPFGGYVKMTGELMGDDNNPDPRSFGAAKLYKRMVITLAGVVMNFLFAIVLLTMLFAHGTEPILVSQADVERAKASGQITVVENENGEKEFKIEEIKLPIHKAFGLAITDTARLSKAVVEKVAEIPKTLLEKGQLPDGLSGPVGIAEITHEMVPRGIWVLMKLTALLSISLAVMNLMPVPGLDGGMLVFQVYEAITRRKPNEKVQGVLTFAGFALLVLFLLAVTWADISRIFIGA